MNSGFQTDLETKLKKGSDGVWIVTAPLKYYSELLQCLIVVPHWFETIVNAADGEPEKELSFRDEELSFFETDFASVPRVPIAYEAWGDRAHREAVLHDYLYRIDSKPVVTYSQANAVFKEAMISTGKPFRIYFWMWCGVVLGGWTAFHKHYVKDCL